MGVFASNDWKPHVERERNTLVPVEFSRWFDLSRYLHLIVDLRWVVGMQGAIRELRSGINGSLGALNRRLDGLFPLAKRKVKTLLRVTGE